MFIASIPISLATFCDQRIKCYLKLFVSNEHRLWPPAVSLIVAETLIFNKKKRNGFLSLKKTFDRINRIVRIQRPSAEGEKSRQSCVPGRSGAKTGKSCLIY
jgi:hypothetical protein